ncbi:MAG TPA: hypothetical protein VE999_21170 [Gemmataceae bacterium]|nr:hypothetical protein [Gemmataceae bacterium]
MDIQESFHRILEQRHAVSRSFFTGALSGCPEVRLIFWGTEGAGPPVEPSSSPQMLCAPLAMYAQFTSDLLRTLREFHGADWNPELMEQWKLAIERVGQAIFAAYQKSVPS